TGGGLFIGGAGAVSITSSTISGNLAQDTGGLRILVQEFRGADVTLADSTVSGNRATGTTGGIRIRDMASLRLIHTTVVANGAQQSEPEPPGASGATHAGSSKRPILDSAATCSW